jgi:2-hydroxychromene-2-carboxylate isomerase
LIVSELTQAPRAFGGYALALVSNQPTPPKPAGAFYFDLASPVCYLAAERILQLLPGVIEWLPVLACETEPFGPFRCEREQLVACAEIERVATSCGLQPIRWPAPLPFDSTLAMRAATYAKSIGRVVSFSQAAFRQAYAGGHSLEELDFVLIAGAASEMHPRAVAQASGSPAVAAKLAEASAAASRLGVSELPAIRLGDELFAGPGALEDAHASLTRPEGQTSKARAAR